MIKVASSEINNKGNKGKITLAVCSDVPDAWKDCVHVSWRIKWWFGYGDIRRIVFTIDDLDADKLMWTTGKEIDSFYGLLVDRVKADIIDLELKKMLQDT